MTTKKNNQLDNPASLGLTAAEFEVFSIVRKRQDDGLTITSKDVAEQWEGKNRSYTYKVLRRLIDKGLIEQYSKRYYRLARRGD